MPLQIRRGSSVQRLAIIPLDGELIWDQTEKRLYVGDGVESGGTIATGYNNEDAILAIGSALDNGMHDGISFIYDETSISAFISKSLVDEPTPELGANLDLSGNDIIGIGNITIDGNIIANTITSNTVVGDLLGNVIHPLDSTVILSDNLLNLGMISMNGESPGLPYPYTSLTSTLSVGKLGINGKLAVMGPENGIIIYTEGTTADNYDLLTVVISKDDSVNESGMVTIRSRGTLDNPTTVQNGDDLFSFIFTGHSPDNDPSIAATIKIITDGIPIGDFVPGKIILETNDNTGNSKEFSINSEGVIGVEANLLTAGIGSGEVDISSVSTYLKIKVGGTEYAMPLYAINP